MAILTSDFAALTDDLQEIFDEVAAGKIADSMGMKIFDVKDTDRRTYDYRVLHGIDVIQRVGEGSDLPEAISIQGDGVTWTQSRYGGIVSITKDMRMFDLYDAIEDRVVAATEDAFDKIDQSLADVLLYGWSTSYTDVYNASHTSTASDGLALFSSVHSNDVNAATYNNQIQYPSGTADPALSREAVILTRTRGRRFRDPLSHVKPVNLDTLVVGPGNEDLALRIVNSDGVQGTADRDSNPLRGRVNVVVWDRLDIRSDDTDTSAYWFMCDSKKVKNSLKALFAQRPTMEAPEQVYKSKNWLYSVDHYYAIGRGIAQYVFGSRGTA